ncbi:type II toxin-antitoxin system HicB family antitoxin [Nioella sp.]|uniref:type II toxin-antitoxin system HicB family antitoxin n=1 Tax=Nioella sp. TaxID=1912091 RepID=UPI003A8A0C5E
MKELKHRGYIGSVDLSIDDGILHGKLLYINDLVTYEAESAPELVAAFHAAVDDYLADCEAEGKAPDTPYKGSFNVRIKPELHRELAETARLRGCSLNEYVASVLTCHKHVELAERFEASTGAKFVLVSSVSGGAGASRRSIRTYHQETLVEQRQLPKTPPFVQWQPPSKARH